MPNTLCTKYFDRRCTTIWILPLIALHDQHHHTCRRYGLTSESWTTRTSSNNPPSNILVTIDQASYDNFKEFISLLINQDLLARINIDEAHLILTHASFRPVMQLLQWIASSPVQIVITTATLPPSLEPLLLSSVGITSSITLRAPTPRNNIAFSVIRAEFERLENVVQTQFTNALKYSNTNRVLLFCLSRREVEEYARQLRVPYCHGGLDAKEIGSILDRFRNDDQCRGLVASSIIGVGLDVPNVSHVLHANLPRDALSFIQEAGRAGRGSPHQPAFSIVMLPPSLPLPTYPSPDLFGAQLIRDSLLNQTLCRRVTIQKFLDGTGETCSMLPTSTHFCDNCLRAADNPPPRPTQGQSTIFLTP
jgi:superfamily II DNA helicase RecQ